MKELILLTLFTSLSLSARAQDFYDLSVIQTIDIVFAQSNWDQILDEAYDSGEYTMALSVTINGETMDSVGVKYKGNSTYRSTQAKNPFHIELNAFKDHEYDGFTDIKLSNVAKDPSFLREVLSYQLLRQYMDAPLSNYANVTVNGQLIGLYSNSEHVGRKFVDKHYGSKDGTRVKCNPVAGAGPQSSDLPNLTYLGEDSTAYYASYELKSDDGWGELIDLCDTLANHPEALPALLDVDRVLWMHAFNNVFVNLDSYLGRFVQNYYLYRDEYNRFIPTVWDLNESFGRFSDTGTVRYNNTQQKAEMPVLLHLNDTQWPLIGNLLSDPQNRRKYLAHVKTMLEENFANGVYEDLAADLRSTIDAAVQSDPNKFFTYNNFLSNLNADIIGGGGPGGGATPGITTLMDARTDFLLGQSEFTQPQPRFDQVVFADVAPALNTSIPLTVTVTDALRVYLNHRTENGAPFTTVEMTDNGDGTFTAELPLAAPQTEYYLYAENDGIGRFAPRRAEHEFFTFTAGTTSALNGDLVINEIMAANDTTRADQDGEFDDWIELHNNLDTEINLGGFYLSDNANNPTKFEFPAGTIIPEGGYLIVWADQDTLQEGFHANFRLSAGGEFVILSDGDLGVIDSIAFGEQEPDVSFGRFPNGTGDFRAMIPTFSAENTDETPGDDPVDFETSPLAGDLVINELLADNATIQADQDDEFDDWIEIHNNDNVPISLAGFTLTDDPTNPAKWTFPAGTSVSADGYLMVWADEDEEQDGLHAAFRLSAAGETVLLLDAAGRLIDSLAYPEQRTDISHGRFANGTGPFLDMTPTFAATNNNGIVSNDFTERTGVDVAVFPNPVGAVLNVRLSRAHTADLRVRLRSADGRLVRDGQLFRGATNLAVQTTGLPDGLYLLTVQDLAGAATYKVIIRK